MLTVVFLAAIFACFQLLGMWLRLKAMEQKFDSLMELLLAPTTEEQPPPELDSSVPCGVGASSLSEGCPLTPITERGL